MKRSLIAILVLALSLLLQNPAAVRPSVPAAAAPPALAGSPEQQVEQAIHQAIAAEDAGAAAFVVYATRIDRIRLSAGGSWASAMLTPLDPQSGQPVPLEPGLALARRQGGAWQAILPDSPAWSGAMQSAPADLFPGEARQNWLMAQSAATLVLPSAPLGGYLLPWKAGLSYYMTQSVHHDKYDSSLKAHYGFDFATPYPSQMFDIYAAKGGTVKWFYDGWENGHQNPSNPNEVNRLVLEDTTTTPTTYQLYLHLAQNSIPAALRRVGAPVMQGQFIGVADNTGNSSGNHLHFHVHTNPNSYWDQSVDITFKDVPINGGRPRNLADLAWCQPNNTYQKYHDVCDQTSERYTSGNVQHGGEIASPLTGDTILSDTLTMQGVASLGDGSLSGAQFIAQYGDSPAWQPVSTVFTTTVFSASWNLCASQVPDGPLSLALRITDTDGYAMSGLPGLKHITKRYTCAAPPPACAPNENQAALFARPDYQGACVVLGSGDYTTTAALDPLGAGKAASVQVGVKAQVTLFAGPGLAGRGETFTQNDSSLADNLVGAGAVASVRVQPRSDPPLTPTSTWPAGGASFPPGASLSLAWDNPGGAAQYLARLSKPGQVITMPLQSEPAWSLGSLAAGSYTWQVKARNSAGESAWSPARSFTVQAGAPPAASLRTLPYTETVETGPDGWMSGSGWTLVTDTNHTPGGKMSWRYSPDQGQDYATAAANAGDLTSPPFTVPAGAPSGATSYLRFWYSYQTEGPGVHWDRRWVQISQDGGPFANLLQLSDDPPDYWLQSPAISLAAYAGHSVQVRFHFETLDERANSFRGWAVDDITLDATPPPACPSGSAGHAPGSVTQITYNSTVSGAICPGEAVDIYSFSAAAGDQVGISVQANSPALDPALFLLDGDQASPLAENDDEVAGVLKDSYLSYRFQRSGTYYLKVRAWDRPTSTDGDRSYTLRLYHDNSYPTARFTQPLDRTLLAGSPITLTVSAGDSGSGISHVQFLAHSGDWQNGTWSVLGEDWQGQDGWSFLYDSLKNPVEIGMAFYAKAYDWSGNWVGTGAWNLNTPHTPTVINLPIMLKSP